MGYSEKIFGKSLREIGYQDIVDFFKIAREENDILEFKSFPPQGQLQDKLKSIYKSVCAFLNSSGGVIIWGAPIGVKLPGKSEKTFQGPLTSLDPTLEKDNLVSRISSNLIPIAGAFNVQFLEDGTGGKICILEIESSNSAPHQLDHIYYMRLDGQSVPAPHHYVEALFKRITYPDLGGYMKFNKIQLEELPSNQLQNKAYYTISFYILIYNWSSIQNEENLFYTLTSDIGEPENYGDPITNSLNAHEKRPFVKHNAMPVLFFGAPYRNFGMFKVDPYKLSMNGGMVSFYLYFGGKKSPLKVSQYKVDINDFRNQPDINKLLVEIKENLFSYEVVDGIGITKDVELKSALGR